MIEEMGEDVEKIFNDALKCINCMERSIMWVEFEEERVSF